MAGHRVMMEKMEKRCETRVHPASAGEEGIRNREEAAGVSDRGNMFGLKAQDLDLMCISDRVRQLEISTREMELLMEAIRSTFAFRMMIKLGILISGVGWVSRQVAGRIKGLAIRIRAWSFRNSFMNISDRVKHVVAGVTRRYYIEDFVRVYPDGTAFDKRGKKCLVDECGEKNFLNHLKFYRFAAQFVKDKCVADVGCGSGYGCEVLKTGGAAAVFGSDISKAAIRFARDRYGGYAEFVVQGITHMKEYRDSIVDVAICSEVLEHVKEYGAEEEAIRELKRITRMGGLLILGTPNAEMLEDHGFLFEELERLLSGNFPQFCIFENAFVPPGKARDSWSARLHGGNVGIIVTQNIELSESVWTEPVGPEIKEGLPAGSYFFSGHEVDTTLLHNTHSWVVLAVNEKER